MPSFRNIEVQMILTVRHLVLKLEFANIEHGGCPVSLFLNISEIKHVIENLTTDNIVT